MGKRGNGSGTVDDSLVGSAYGCRAIPPRRFGERPPEEGTDPGGVDRGIRRDPDNVLVPKSVPCRTTASQAFADPSGRRTDGDAAFEAVVCERQERTAPEKGIGPTCVPTCIDGRPIRPFFLSSNSKQDVADDTPDIKGVTSRFRDCVSSYATIL